MSQAAEDQAVIQEAFELLLTHMGPAKVARLLSAFRAPGTEDYMTWRDRYFAGMTMDDLVNQIQAEEKKRAS